MAPGVRPLGSTYRLQLHGLGFAGAQHIVPYLHQLGIDTLYVSPILAAVPGSTHGYDVIDPTMLDPQLGSPSEFEALLDALGSQGMRLLIDVVPNHMATDFHDHWWWDVLRRGTNSEFADVFDIDWTQHEGRVLIPTLPEPLADLVQQGQVNVVEREGETVLLIGEQAFPLDPDSLTFGDEPMQLLHRQHYRPAFWRLGRDEGNYRRFFDIDGLVGVKVELPDVRTRTHDFLLTLLEDDRVAGLRIDHIDGLADPQGYLHWLNASLSARRPNSATVLVEKILLGPETLPSTWEVDGTTGYEFASIAGGLFVDADGADLMHEASAMLTGLSPTFEDLARQGKREVMATSFSAQVKRLGTLMSAFLSTFAPGSDVATSDLERAITEMVVRLPVYRTYLGGQLVSPGDRTLLLDCVSASCEVLDGQGQRAARMIGDVLLLAGSEHVMAPEIAQRWEQLSGAVMAKGVEDTASYRYTGLLSHAEVGSDPDHASRSTEEFFSFTSERGRHFPMGLNATSTHDSKRGEDTRARLYALSEAAPQWNTLVGTWHRRHAELLAGMPGPAPSDEMLIYQTLVGVWPSGADNLDANDWQRVSEYLVKAAREAKLRTTWVDPDEAYEGALRSFVNLLGQTSTATFRAELNGLVELIEPCSATNGLALTVLKSICPGVPDFYQGTELWTHSLTDPDNRRPVNFDVRRQAIRDLPDFTPAVDGWPDGRVKLQVTQSLLTLRRERPALFSNGMYSRVEVEGPLREHVVAVSRRHGPNWLLALVPRLMLQHLAPGQFAVGDQIWAGTHLVLPEDAPMEFVNVLTRQSLSLHSADLEVGDALSRLPVAVLHGV